MARLSAQHLALPLHEPLESLLFIDHASRSCVVVKHDVFLTFPLPAPEGEAAQSAEDTRVITDIPQGKVISARISPCKRFLMVQRSSQQIDLHDLATGNAGRYYSSLVLAGITRERRLLSYHWISSAATDSNDGILLLVTNNGLELYVLTAEDIAEGNYSPSMTERFDASWSQYDAVAQVLLVATGPRANVLRIFRLDSPSETRCGPLIVPLAPIEIQMMGGKRAGTGPPLARSDVTMAALYNTLYVIQIERRERKILLFSVGGASTRPLQVDMYNNPSDRLHLSVMDNLLVLHNADLRVNMIYDIKLSTRTPVIPPRELLPATQGVGVEGGGAADKDARAAYQESWSYPQPWYIVDAEIGKVWRVCLDIDEIVKESQDQCWLTEFLLRRKQSQKHVLQVLLTCARSHEPLEIMAKLLELCAAVYYFINFRVRPDHDPKYPPDHELPGWDGEDAAPSAEGGVSETMQGVAIVDDYVAGGGAAAADQLPSSAQSEEVAAVADPVINQLDFFLHIFQPLQRDASISKSYFVALVLEYVRNLHGHGVTPHPHFHTMIVDELLAQPDKIYRLHQLLQYRVIDDSVTTAGKLLAQADSQQLGLDMLHRLGLYNDVVRNMLARDEVTAALRYAAALPAVTVPAAEYIQAAARAEDACLLTATKVFLAEKGISS